MLRVRSASAARSVAVAGGGQRRATLGSLKLAGARRCRCARARRVKRRRTTHRAPRTTRGAARLRAAQRARCLRSSSPPPPPHSHLTSPFRTSTAHRLTRTLTLRTHTKAPALVPARLGAAQHDGGTRVHSRRRCRCHKYLKRLDLRRLRCLASLQRLERFWRLGCDQRQRRPTSSPAPSLPLLRRPTWDRSVAGNTAAHR